VACGWQGRHSDTARESGVDRETVWRAVVTACDRACDRGIEADGSELDEKKDLELAQSKPELLPSEPDDVLECDEVWSYVGSRQNKLWLWFALCRRTRQIVAFVLGCRGTFTAKRLHQAIPKDYQHCLRYTDLWLPYKDAFPPHLHSSSHRPNTNHIERFNNTLRQQNPKLVRKTLSFAKSQHNLEQHVRLFIKQYNHLAKLQFIYP
jgi:IS1 family transposase